MRETIKHDWYSLYRHGRVHSIKLIKREIEDLLLLFTRFFGQFLEFSLFFSVTILLSLARRYRHDLNMYYPNIRLNQIGKGLRDWYRIINTNWRKREKERKKVKTVIDIYLGNYSDETGEVTRNVGRRGNSLHCELYRTGKAVLDWKIDDEMEENRKG